MAEQMWFEIKVSGPKATAEGGKRSAKQSQVSDDALGHTRRGARPVAIQVCNGRQRNGPVVLVRLRCELGSVVWLCGALVVVKRDWRSREVGRAP